MDDGFSEGPTLQDQLAGMTVEERQEMINDEHPFGIMLWKPALRDEHSAESDSLESEAVVEPHVNRIYPQMPGFQLANLIWSLTLGWVLGLCFFSASVLASFISVAIWAIELDDGSVKLGILAFNLRELARYVFSPFGLNLIRAVHVDNWDSEALPASAESAPLLPRTTRSVEAAPQHPKFLHTMRIILTITVFPMLFGAAAVCWLLIFPIPTAKFLVKLGHELWRDPITLRVGVPTVNESHQERALESQTDLFRESAGYSSRDEAPLLSISKCTNRKFLSYTVAGMNVFIVNSLALPFFTLLLAVLSASPSVLFALALLSIIPCAYLIGAAVSAITNLTGNLALGGVLNATFGSIVELLIYTSMIRQGGKAKLVEGSLIGSFLFGLLGMPGLSMFFGGMRRRSMPFNARATGVTVTLLILSVIGVFVPTLFHNTFAPWDLFCEACPGNGTLPDSAGAKSCDMSRCWMKQPCGSASPLFVGSTRPLVFFCCGILVVTYFVGLFYTLRTHRKHIYKKDAKRRRRPKEAKPKGSGSAISRPSSDATLRNAASAPVDLPSATSERPASSSSFRRQESLRSASPSGPVDVSDVVPLRPAHLLMGDLNATSATVINSGSPDRRPVTPTPSPMPIPAGPLSVASSSAGSVSVDGEEHNGPAWNIGRSVAVLMSSTVLFSLVAEVLVRNVDAVLAAGDGDALPLDPKILGLVGFCCQRGPVLLHALTKPRYSRRYLQSFRASPRFTIRLASPSPERCNLPWKSPTNIPPRSRCSRSR